MIYAILTEESVGRAFMAGVIPGLLLTALFILAIWIFVTGNAEKAPSEAEAYPMSERWAAMAR